MARTAADRQRSGAPPVSKARASACSARHTSSGRRSAFAIARLLEAPHRLRHALVPDRAARRRARPRAPRPPRRWRGGRRRRGARRSRGRLREGRPPPGPRAPLPRRAHRQGQLEPPERVLEPREQAPRPRIAPERVELPRHELRQGGPPGRGASRARRPSPPPPQVVPEPLHGRERRRELALCLVEAPDRAQQPPEEEARLRILAREPEPLREPERLHERRLRLRRVPEPPEELPRERVRRHRRARVARAPRQPPRPLEPPARVRVVALLALESLTRAAPAPPSSPPGSPIRSWISRARAKSRRARSSCPGWRRRLRGARRLRRAARVARVLAALECLLENAIARPTCPRSTKTAPRLLSVCASPSRSWAARRAPRAPSRTRRRPPRSVVHESATPIVFYRRPPPAGAGPRLAEPPEPALAERDRHVVEAELHVRRRRPREELRPLDGVDPVPLP